MWNDLKIAARSLGRARAFTVAVVVTLALGIGATSAIFSVVNAVLLDALPYKDPGRLMVVSGREGGIGGPGYPTSYLDLTAIRQVSRRFILHRRPHGFHVESHEFAPPSGPRVNGKPPT